MKVTWQLRRNSPLSLTQAAVSTQTSEGRRRLHTIVVFLGVTSQSRVC